MDKLDNILGNIGNIRKDYRHEPRHVSYTGLVASPNLVMKLYAMFKKLPVSWDLIVDAKKFLVLETETERIEPLTGMGFAILSEDTLNVARWDKESPIVLKNQVYGYINLENKIGFAELLNTQEVGSFCIWELGIVNFEKNAWKEYLASERKEQDKKQYLDSVINGGL